MTNCLNIATVDTFVFRCPLETPVQTSFGIMQDRPRVLVRITDTDGICGWGEIWCNFPAVGAEHRARLVDSVFNPLLAGKSFEKPEEVYHYLSEAIAILALQSAEPGPFAQAIAGIDIAIWDLASRQSGQPLWKYLGGNSPEIKVYASGLNPTEPEILAERRHAEGFCDFKLKIGFGKNRDLTNLKNLQNTLGPDAELMADANQGWTLDEAKDQFAALEPFSLNWIEEPLRADRPWSEWQALKETTSIPIAAGENLLGELAFQTALKSNVLKVVQPDIAKWGGFTACSPVVQQILKSGARYCPHYLGGGVGLLASAHLLAAFESDGMLEIDANANPLRSLLCGPLNQIEHGKATLTEEIGLGIDPNLSDLEDYAVQH